MAKKYGIQIKGLGKALKPKGPGVLRPKPQDRYGRPFKPKPIGKKDGGKVIRKYPSGSDIPRPLQKQPLKRKGVDTKTLKEKILPKKKKDRLEELRKELGRKGMKKGGRAKFPDLTGDGKVTRADVLKGRGVFRKGGRANTRRMNRLEELGRVDSEKAYSRRGKRNLKSEKKRIVRELNK